MNFIGALAELTDEWLYSQIYGPRGDGKFEVRLPKYSKSESLMYGEGTTLEDAILDLLGKVAEVEDKDLDELGLSEVQTGSAELEFEAEGEVKKPNNALLYASPGGLYASPGGGKNHIFDEENVSLCGRAELPEDFDGEMQLIGERPPNEETDCKLCVKEYQEATTEEGA